MKKKILALCLVVVLAVTAVTGVTLAYFTDTDNATNTFTVGNVDIELDEPAWESEEKHNFMPGTNFEKDPYIYLNKPSEDSWVFMEVSMNKFNSWLRLVCLLNDENGNLFTYGKVNGVECECGADCQGHIVAEGLLGLFQSDAYQAAFDQWFKDADHENWKIMNLEDVLETLEASWTDNSIKTLDVIFGYKNILTLDGEEGEDKTTALFKSVEMPDDVTSKMLEDSRFNTTHKDWVLDITAYGIQAENLDTLDAAYVAMFPEN